MVILRDRSSVGCEFKVIINKVMAYDDVSALVDITVSFYSGSVFPEINASMNFESNDLIRLFDNLARLKAETFECISAYDPGLAIYSNPILNQNNELYFEIIISIDAGLIINNRPSSSGPAITLTVKQEDLCVFSTEFKRQLNNFPRSKMPIDVLNCDCQEKTDPVARKKLIHLRQEKCDPFYLETLEKN
ncbi:MAG: hypothetical protein AB1815_07715 [Bacillota bacterium]